MAEPWHVLTSSQTLTSWLTMSAASKLDRLFSVLITVSAMIVAISVAHRSFFAQPAPRTAQEREPVFVDDWKEGLDAGVRLGPDTAPVTIVDVADLECPVCRAFYSTVREIQQEYPDAVSVIHVSFPLSYHKFAMPAARAAECADRAEKFREWIGVVYDKQDSLGVKSWGSYAADAGIPDTTAIVRCALDAAKVERIEAGLAFGERIGLTGTPTVLINGWMLSGPPSKERLRVLVEQITKGEDPFKKKRRFARN